MANLSEQVVDKQSALTGLDNERLFPVNANHRTLCKIPSSTSHQYKTVGSWIAKLTQHTLENAIAHGRLCTFIMNITRLLHLSSDNS